MIKVRKNEGYWYEDTYHPDSYSFIQSHPLKEDLISWKTKNLIKKKGEIVDVWELREESWLLAWLWGIRYLIGRFLFKLIIYPRKY